MYFAKAFDKVPHQCLLNKLNYYGSVAWPFLRSRFLHDRKQHVLVEGAKSDEAQVTSGVPQGTVMSPLLFHAFINDLPWDVDSQAKLFADDCLLFRPIGILHDSTNYRRTSRHLKMGVWLTDVLLSTEVYHHPCNSQERSLETSYRFHGHTFEVEEENTWEFISVMVSLGGSIYTTNHRQCNKISRIPKT